MDRYNIGTYKDLEHSTLETSIEISAGPYEVETEIKVINIPLISTTHLIFFTYYMAIHSHPFCRRAAVGKRGFPLHKSNVRQFTVSHSRGCRTCTSS